METLYKVFRIFWQAALLLLIAACGSRTTYSVQPSNPNMGGGAAPSVDEADVEEINIPASPDVPPADILEHVVFMGTGGEEGIGCPCIFTEGSMLYLEGFSPNQSLRLIAYDEYENDFGYYLADWLVAVDASGDLAITLNGYQGNIEWLAVDPSTGKQKGPAGLRVYDYEEVMQPSTTYARISGEVTEVNLRASPGYLNKDESSDVLAKIPSGDSVEILDGPLSADGLDWWQVSWNGLEGYVADHTGSGRVILVFP